MRTLGIRLASAGSAILALGALLVGVPWFLYRFTDATHLLGVDWVAALTLGADSRLILGLFSVVAWAAWAVVALTVLLELIAVLSRQRIRVTLPGTGWLRPAVGALVMAAVASPTLAMADGGTAPLVAEPPRASAAAGMDATAPAASSTAPAGRGYTVQPGDELWAIAERELGSGERWREIVALNEGVSDVSRLHPGAILTLPEDAAEPPHTVVVQEGDTLWHIAGAELGDPSRWPELHRANADTVADPDLIEVGWELRLPEGAAGAVAPVAEPAPEAVAEPTTPPTVEQAESPTTSPPRSPEEAVAEAFGRGYPIDAAPPEHPQDPPAAAGQEATETDEAADADDQDTGSAEDFSGMLEPVGAALASSVLLGVATRRRAQVLARALGRRLIPVPREVSQFWTALAHRSEATVAGAPASGPTAVVLGWDGEEAVNADLEAERAVLFDGDEAVSALGAIVTELSCNPSASSVSLVVVGGDDWVRAIDDPRVSSENDTAAGLHRLARLCSERRLAMRQGTLAAMRADDDLRDAFAPTVVVFLERLEPAHLDAVGDALALGEVGVSVVAPTVGPSPLRFAQVLVSEEQGLFRGRTFTPQLVTAPARRALVELFATTGRLDTEPAPWWKGDDDLPPNVLPLPRLDRPEERPMTTRLSSPPHPVLSLLGPVELGGTTGIAPTRALGQCLEYCAWLLQNPGATPSRMLRDLQVADATRRSNMSRLRTWLGADPAGQPYLPDAYTGRIALDERVTSDWEQFVALLSGGVNMAGSHALRDALAMVRGEPLGTFGFQWQWAQQLRADMIAMIVDAACVLADRSLDQGDLETAMWAIARGRLGSPSDDALAVREIEALLRAGSQADAEHAVVRLNRALRAEGRDLEPALAIRVQDAMQTPARRALSE
ncbi:LysM peptidoglycan-binding domain-containing protein [Tessaracoccus sp. Y36]